jgi:glycosyltransferase involved in cell wall biosynthesis
MRITILHNLYKHRGGEDAVVEAEADLLRQSGHAVQVELVSNNDIASMTDKMRTFVRAPFDPDRRPWAMNLFARTRPDVVHIHNFFPLLTPAVHHAARQHGAAVVQTLHNYRLLCAAATFSRDGAVCEKCLEGSNSWGIVHRCYRGSVLGSLAVARMQWRAAQHRTWHSAVDRFVALTEFARGKFIAGGLPAERVVVKSNFAVGDKPTSRSRSGALYVGRLSAEKGVATLLQGWLDVPGVQLRVIGDGPERRALEAMAPANVHFLGQLPQARVRELMQQSQCLIVPSVWYEGFPLVVAEAFAAGLPVLAARIGALGEVVVEGVNGRHFAPGDAASLAKVAREALSARSYLDQLSAGARATYETKYTPEINLRQLEAIYEAALTQAQAAG